MHYITITLIAIGLILGLGLLEFLMAYIMYMFRNRGKRKNDKSSAVNRRKF